MGVIEELNKYWTLIVTLAGLSISLIRFYVEVDALKRSLGHMKNQRLQDFENRKDHDKEFDERLEAIEARLHNAEITIARLDGQSGFHRRR